jgi:hypothetical protein
MNKLIALGIFAILSTPVLVFAQQDVPKYNPLVNVFATGGTPSFDSYINLLYVTSISLAAMLAVVKIIIAGFKYMLSDVVSSKGDALSDIRGALLGLLLILGIYVILNVINPDLVKEGGLKFDSKVSAPPAQQSVPGVRTTPPGGIFQAPGAPQGAQLIPQLDLTSLLKKPAEAQAALSDFSNRCKAAGGSVTLNPNNIQQCRAIAPAPTPEEDEDVAIPTTPKTPTLDDPITPTPTWIPPIEFTPPGEEERPQEIPGFIPWNPQVPQEVEPGYGEWQDTPVYNPSEPIEYSPER